MPVNNGGGASGITIELDPNAVPLAGGSMTGTLFVPEIRNLLNENLVLDAYNDTGAGTHNLFKFNPFGGGLELPANSAGIKFGDDTIQTTAPIPVFTNQIVTNSSVVKMETFPHEVVLAETDAGTVYSSSKKLRDFIHREDGNSYVKNYTLDGFGTILFESVSCANVRTFALTNMPYLESVKIVNNTGTIENINFNGSTNVTYLNLGSLTFSTTNMSNMVSNFVMKSASNTLFLTNLNLAGAIPSTWYNNLTSTLGIDGVAVNNLSFINPTTFPSLKWLRLGDNVAASLPSINFASFTQLENLYAKGRGVNGVDLFTLPASLKAVDLSNSNFHDWEASMSTLTLPNLISMNFSYCNLNAAEFIPINAGVKYLNLEGNDFSGDYGAGRDSIIGLLDAIDALNESGFISTEKHKELKFTGSLMPVFTTIPTSATNLINRGYYVELRT